MHFVPSYPMLSVNSSSITCPSILIPAFIKQDIHFISFHLSLFSVNSSSKFVRTRRTLEQTCPWPLVSELCWVFFSLYLAQTMAPVHGADLYSCEALTTVGLVRGICAVWVLITNPQLGDAMLCSLALEIVRRAAVFSLKRKISINVQHSA